MQFAFVSMISQYLYIFVFLLAFEVVCFNCQMSLFFKLFKELWAALPMLKILSSNHKLVKSELFIEKCIEIVH